MSMKVILIHGANATKAAWNWLGSNIKDHVRLEWFMSSTPEENLQAMEALLPDEPCMVLGHSMGGLYAWHLAERNPGKIISGISLATPWGGSIQASFWRSTKLNLNMPWLEMFSRIEPWTKKARTVAPSVPWTNIVCTHGFDMFAVGPNDGVLTVVSQQEIYSKDEEIILNYGHNEVLQSNELVEIVKLKSKQ